MKDIENTSLATVLHNVDLHALSKSDNLWSTWLYRIRSQYLMPSMEAWMIGCGGLEVLKNVRTRGKGLKAVKEAVNGSE